MALICARNGRYNFPYCAREVLFRLNFLIMYRVNCSKHEQLVLSELGSEAYQVSHTPFLKAE
jgi:hypothetical protein